MLPWTLPWTEGRAGNRAPLRPDALALIRKKRKKQKMGKFARVVNPQLWLLTAYPQ